MNNLKFLVVDLPEDVSKAVIYGDFDKALKLIDLYMARNIPQVLKDRLDFEKDRIRRFKEDYTYTFDEALALAQENIKNFSKKELEYIKDARYADWIYIDGEIKFHNRFLENAIKVHPTLKERLISPEKNTPDILDEVIEDIIQNGETKYFIHVKTGLKLNSKYKRKGEKIRVYLPIPRNAQQIKNIRIINTSHEPKFISPVNYPQRTIYFEEIVNEKDEFTVEYSYENHIKYNDISADKVSENQPTFYTEEWLPHIRFTPFLVELTKTIVGDEKNPLLKARKIYNYITQNVQYSYVRQYAAITNIPEYAAYNLKGDCGVQALLFITLCRIAGIPARWQSGLVVNPYNIGCHDWAEFYIEPFGWIFADLSFGGSALRRGNKKRWNFYFGNLDPFRMVANSEFQYDFYPEKKFLRQDPYDNQTGEMEYLDRPIFQNEYEIIQEIIEVEKI
ncbi:transglutaminase-like putative cysteine protease [Keratinibaculum paraultunense]|uniref:Transglutaminase-like putative cysteine protease n=1 Tax=Keratinibaculum paraultunense TaxID=1278232 RepID=A0A4R3KZ66_9FIRM|nr:transglutaminase domain-containing protein [Keratinibaculum paraultunense]QQY79002.1 transglutaminase domain-containing protein [Keratinibaculum paraultunense]TCS90624.1 transglutaminase-like putative cysteine protease [Keratinibaculum paraultunense]